MPLSLAPEESAADGLPNPAAQPAAGIPAPRGPLPQKPAPTPIPGSRIPSPGQSPIPRR